MNTRSTEDRLLVLLTEACADGALDYAAVTTEQGLPLAVAGTSEAGEELSAIASLFDEVVLRAARDLRLPQVDEVALRDAVTGSVVVRPVGEQDGLRILLVVQVPKSRPWRRLTRRLCRDLREELDLRADT